MYSFYIPRGFQVTTHIEVRKVGGLGSKGKYRCVSSISEIDLLTLFMYGTNSKIFPTLLPASPFVSTSTVEDKSPVSLSEVSRSSSPAREGHGGTSRFLWARKGTKNLHGVPSDNPHCTKTPNPQWSHHCRVHPLTVCLVVYSDICV